MQIRLLVLCAVSAAALHAQSISITSPTSGASWTGWTGQQFAASLTSAPSVVLVCYSVDAHPATNAGANPLAISGNGGALLASGCSNTAPFSFPVNSFLWGNSSAHIVTATAYDSLGNAVATSAPVTFTIANTWPVSCSGSAPNLTLSVPSSPLSGRVNVTATMNGPCAPDNIDYTIYVDGVYQYGQTTTAGSLTASLDTTAFTNGVHVIAATALDTTNYVNYSGTLSNFNVQAAGEQSISTTFSNSAVPMEVRNTSSATGAGGEVLYLAPLATQTLSPTLVNTDQSITSGASFFYWSSNTSVATVSPTGTSSASSATVTGVAQGAAKLYVMYPAVTITDAHPAGVTNLFTSATLGARPTWVNRMAVETSSANGCIPGTYFLGGASASGVYTTQSAPTVNANFVSSASGGPCTFELGQTRVAWAQINSTNAAIPHFSNAGSVRHSYTPGSSVVIQSLYGSIGEVTGQVYPTPLTTAICNSGYNSYEFGVPSDAATGWSTDYASYSAMVASITSFIQTQKGYINTGGCTPMIWTTGDNQIRELSYLYAAAQGPTSARNGSTWSQSGIAAVFQAIANANAMGGPQVAGMTAMDEFSYSATPLQGPITLSSTGNVQNWLGGGQIDCTQNSGTVCVVTANALGPMKGWSGFQTEDGEVITGSVNGFNSTAGETCLAWTSISATQFSFPKPSGVTAAVYNSSNDPNLRIWASTSACGWFTPPGGSSATDFSWDDDLAYWRSQINSVSGHIPVAPSIAASGTLIQTACANGGANSYCGQSLTENGSTISGLGDFDDHYWTHVAQCEVYLMSHQQLNGYINDLIPSCSIEEVPYLRLFYGSYDPTSPLVTISEGTPAWYGFLSAQNLTVTSCMGNTITFASAHHIVNFLPGFGKLSITGSTDPNCNTNFMILSAPTATTLTVARASTAVTCVDSGGCASHNLASATLTFQNGDTYCPSGCTFPAMYEIQAGGANDCGTGNPCAMGFGSTKMDYGTSECTNTGSAAFLRHRGQTFTISGATGSQASYFNSLTGYYDIENLAQPTDGNGTTWSCYNYWREIPNLNGTAGTASIIPDGSLIPGRNAWNAMSPGNADPYQTQLSIVGAMYLRAAGHRLYQFQDNPNGYNPIAYGAQNKGGWVSINGTANAFGQSYLVNQLYSHSNAENWQSVPDFWAGSTASRMWTRVAKYYLGATALDAIDYGPLIQSGTFQSAYGYLHMLTNFSNGTATRTVTLTPYETSGQNVILWIADPLKGILPLTIISAGTATYSLTLAAGEAAYFVFPINFAIELDLPTVALRLADVPNATSIGASCGYDPYLLPNAAPVNLGGGTGGLVTAQLMMDKNVAPVYCTLSYLGSSNQLLAGGPKSAAMTF
jgi:hypothetical protein